MSRLQKKCLIASSALHALLVVIVLAGSAFLLKREAVVDQTVLNFIPDKLVDDAMKRATGAPAPATAQPPVAQPTLQPVQPVVQPSPPRVEPKPEPEKPRVKKEPVKPEPEPEKKDPTKVATTKPKPAKVPKAVVAPPQPKPGPVVNLRPIIRSNADLLKQQEEAATTQAAQAAKAAAAFESRKGQLLSAFTTRAASLTTENIGLSAIDTGTIGISYASYNDWVKKVYWDAWQPPNDLPPGDSTVTVRVTIRKDGSVAGASVTDPSGVSKLDDNIRKLLARVKTIGKSFPDGANEETRTYNIDFNLKAKLGAG